jgi:hypothetical protein
MAEEHTSAADNLGPHLLGRIPSPPDERDFKLENYLHVGAPTLSNTDIQALLDGAVAHLKNTTVGYAGHSVAWQNRTTTEWYKGLDGIAKARAALGGTPPPSPTPTGDVVYADNEPVLDQGQYGTCVGNGLAQFLNTNPIDDKFTEGMGQSATSGGPYARALYYEATVLDGAPDDPDAPGGGQQGANVRSGMKALLNRKRIAAYAVASTLDDIKTYMHSGKGSMVVGTNWTNDMFNPDVNGYVKPTGSLAGGHCYLLVGDLPSEGAFLFQNSWGSGWGKNGRFKMKYADFQTLMNQQGEVWGAVELPLA